jgi:hypothetical protein
MPHSDRHGLPLSTASDAAAEAYRAGIDLMLSAWTGAAEAFAASIRADPDFALAHAAQARLEAMRGEGAAARAAIALARDLAHRRGTSREVGHVAVLADAIEGRTREALDGALAHLEDWPRDALILSLPLGAFGLFAFSGMSDHDAARVALCERHAHHYGEDWWFLTYRGWARIEAGEVAAGRDQVTQALVIRPANANAVHALSHAMFEQGAGSEAQALIGGFLPGYDRAAPLHGHIAWHQALALLEAGDAAGALAVFADRVRPGRTGAAPINVVTDGASFLWRLRAYGHEDPAALWQEAAAYAATAFPDGGNAFVEVHLAMIAAATGTGPRAIRDAATLGELVPAVARALDAFAGGDHAGCARLLEPVVAAVVRIGGSHAQREVIEDTLLAALLRGGEAAKAHVLLDARLHRRPSPRDASWRGALPDRGRMG